MVIKPRKLWHKEARSEFIKLRDWLEAQDVLEDVDSMELMLFGDTYHRYITAVEAYLISGLTTDNTKGVPVKAPEVVIAETAIRQLSKIKDDLGALVRNRKLESRLNKDYAAKIEDYFDQFMKGSKRE